MQSLLRVISHDLRSPLVNIDGFSGSLSNNCKKLRKLLANESISEDTKKQVFELIEETIPEDLPFQNSGVLGRGEGRTEDAPVV